MLINQDFSADRTKFIGGSDVGAILGLSKFRSPLEVWMEKTGKGEASKDSLPLRFGSFAEAFVASEYTIATGLELLHDESAYIHPDHPFMISHIDRFVLGDGVGSLPTKILECKTANPFSKGEWGEPGSDLVPMSYLCQCIWYMAITGIDHCDLAVLFGNNDFRIYEITKDKQLENLILEKAHHFWNAHVLKDQPPPAQNEEDYQHLFSKGVLGKQIEASALTLELTKRLHVLKEEIDVREQDVAKIKQGVMAQMGEAETLTYQGQILATWKSPKEFYRLDSKSLEADQPELFKKYKLPVQSSRRLVIKELVLE